MLKKLSKTLSQILGTPAAGSGRNHRQPRRFRPGIETLEGRWVPSTLQVVNGLLTYTAGTGVANNLTVTAVDAGGDGDATNYDFTDTSELILAPGFQGSGTHSVIVPAEFVGSMVINLGDKADALSVEQTLDDVSVKAGDGDDRIDVGKLVGGTLAGVQAAVTVDGEAGTDTVRVNDPASGVSRTYTVTATRVTPAGGSDVNYAGVERLTVTAGAVNDTFTVRGTAAGTTTTLSAGAGFDTFNVGSTANTLDDVKGHLTLNGGSNFPSPLIGLDRVNLFDQGSSVSNSYAVRENSVARSSGVVVAHSGVELATLHAGAAADSVVVLSTSPVPFLNTGTLVTLNMGGGDDVIDVATRTGTSLDLIASTVTVNGGAGADTVLLNDQTDANANSYVLTASDVTRNGTRVLSYDATVENLTLNAGAFDDTASVQGAQSATRVTLKMGGGNDTVTVGSAAGSLQPTVGIVTVDGQAGADRLTVNDQAPSLSFFDYTVTATSVARNGWVSVGYAGMENLTLNGASGTDPLGSNFFTVLSTSVPTEINGASIGKNVFLVGNDPLDDVIRGALTLNGSGVGELVLLDDLEAAPSSYIVTATSVARSGAALISYFKMGSLAIVGGYAPNTATVTSTSPGTPVKLDLHGGNDTVTLGNGPFGMDAIASPVSVPQGYQGLPSIAIVLNDAQTFGNNDYRLTEGEVTRNGRLILNDFMAGNGLALNAGSGADTVRLASSPLSRSPVVVRGGLGNDTFIVENFHAPSLAGRVTLDGQGGTDTLDYSGYYYPTTVRVNLALGTATGAAGGVSNIENVTGGVGDDILIGDDQANVLNGGPGRDILIGGGGADALFGGVADDILIGSSTDHDFNALALEAIMEEWGRTDLGYSARIGHLKGTLDDGDGFNGTTFLTLSKVNGDGVADILDGGSGLDWFFRLGADVITALQSGERVN